MVIINKGVRASLLDKIFYYKAPNDKLENKDRVGCKQFNIMNKLNYDPEWRKKTNIFDMTKINDFKKGNKIRKIAEKDFVKTLLKEIKNLI